MPDRVGLLCLSLVAALGAACAAQPRTVGSPSPSGSSATPAQPSVQRTPPVNLSGYSAAFKQGYTDGCASVRGSMRRDDTRYRSDSDYMMGWSDGNSSCGAKR